MSRSPKGISSQLQGILSKMKVAPESNFDKIIAKYGNSDMFNYATNKQYDPKELKAPRLATWDKFSQYDTENSCIRLPLSGFHEMIRLTEQGKLWKYPIDNEQGMREHEVPFEDHVFFDQYLEEFSKNENVQTFMKLVMAGLARNYWMSVDRKRDIIMHYRDYFKEKNDVYKASGLDL